jgi:hypothetical protein
VKTIKPMRMTKVDANLEKDLRKTRREGFDSIAITLTFKENFLFLKILKEPEKPRKIEGVFS